MAEETNLNITAEDLLAGVNTDFDVTIPPEIVNPVGEDNKSLTVKLKPLSIGTFQLILKAARSDSTLVPLLMLKESLVNPVMSLEQIKNLNMGIIKFLMEQVRSISGLTEKKTLKN